MILSHCLAHCVEAGFIFCSGRLDGVLRLTIGRRVAARRRRPAKTRPARARLPMAREERLICGRNYSYARLRARGASCVIAAAEPPDEDIYVY